MRRLKHFCAFIFALLFSTVANAQPINDIISNARSIQTTMSVIYGATFGASMEPGEADFANGEFANNSVWYQYTATQTGQAVIWMVQGGDSDPARLGVDVFRGVSFAASSRISAAFYESVTRPIRANFIRLQFPTVANQVYSIRVAARQTRLGRIQNSTFVMQIRQFGNSGGYAMVPVPVVSGPTTTPLFIAESSDRFYGRNFTRLYTFINAGPSAATATLRSTIPGSVISYTSQSVPGRTIGLFGKPGFQLASVDLNGSLAYPGRFGLWNHVITAQMKFGTRVFNSWFPVSVQRYRSDRARITAAFSQTALAAPIGSWVGTIVTFSNPTPYTATGCRPVFLDYNRDGPMGMSWMPMFPGAGRDRVFTIPANGSISVRLSLRPDFIGDLTGIRLQAVCSEAPFVRLPTVLSLRGNP